MLRTRLLPAIVLVAVAGSTLAAEAATIVQPAPAVVEQTHPFSRAQRDQLAFEAGISAKQAEGLTIGQLAWLKEQRDARPYFMAPVRLDPATIHS